MAQKEFSIRKKQTISKSQRTMFVTVALASAFVGTCLVGSWFLMKRLMFNHGVISEQQKAISNIGANIDSIKKLDSQVQVLKTNELLLAKKSYKDETALQVVLDALPDRANTPAFGESLRSTILNVPGAEIEQMSLTKTEDEVDSEFSGLSSVSYNEEYNDISEPAMYFRINISGTATVLNKVLQNIEHSIRPILVDKVEIQSNNRNRNERGEAIAENDRQHTMIITARTFYSYRVNPTIKTKTMKEKQ
ncbi:MAG: hypothetical protein Q3996_00770 [Candidatus Saccharibacteria bacterium]|nr:hypothetical protein [Candidatus Saccharibacteria bacterium]